MIQSRKDYKFYIDQDRKNLGLGHYSLKEWLFPNYIWKFQKLLRKVEYYSNTNQTLLGKAYLIFLRMKLRKLQLRLGFSIPINVFGPGLSIAHYGSIVINPNTRIGTNCRLHSSTNIGASGGDKKAPQIGDNVYIGPGAIIFGDIEIANNVTIGANATVNKSCQEEFVVLAGSPAKIVKHWDKSWLQFNMVAEK